MKWNDADVIAFRLGLFAGQHSKIRAQRRPEWRHKHWLINVDGDYQWLPPKDHAYPPVKDCPILQYRHALGQPIRHMDLEDYAHVYSTDKERFGQADGVLYLRKRHKNITLPVLKHQLREVGYDLA